MLSNEPAIHSWLVLWFVGEEKWGKDVLLLIFISLVVFCTNKFDEWKNTNVESVGSYVKEEGFVRRGGSLHYAKPLYVLQ